MSQSSFAFDAPREPNYPSTMVAQSRATAESSSAECAVGPNPALRMARSTDPATSHDAAQKAVGLAQVHQERIRAALNRLGRPAGAEELEPAVDLPAYSIRKRLPELQRAGQAEPTDQTRVTSTGRRERLWRAC